MSEEYKASQEDVHFDNGRADQLMRQLREASEYLHTTDSTQRSGARDQAMTEFAGPYADLFAHNTETALRDGKRLGDALSDAANELQKYKELARLEQENRQKARDWDKRDFFQQFGDSWSGKKKPETHSTGPSLRTPPPATESSSQGGEGKGGSFLENVSDMVMDTLDPARKNIKVGGPGVSKTSAIPDNLDVYFNQARTLSEDLGKKLESIQKEYQGFMENTSWGQFDIMGLLKATGDWAGKNMEDASFVHVIAEAFRQAGASSNMVATYDSFLIEEILAKAGVKAQERKELDIPLATVAGADLTSGFVNDPVNAATGNFIEEELDLSFPGTGSGTLRLERMYNSLAVTHPDEIPSGVFGPGWASTLDQHMEFIAQEARWHTHDGRILFFAREGEGYARCTHEPWWLQKATIGADQYERFAQLRDEAYSQAKTGTAGSSAPFYWVVSNAKHHRIFFTPAGDWAGIKAKDPKILKDEFIDKHTTFMGKTGGEVIGNMTSGAIEGAYEYSKNAGDDWSVRGMMLSATTGGIMKGASAGFKMAPNYVTNKVNYTKLPGIRHLPDGGRIQRLAASGVKNTTSQIAEMPINVGMSSVEALPKNRILQMDRNDYMAQHPGDNPEALNRAKVKDKSGADLMWDAAGAEIQKQGDYKNLAKNGAKTWKDRKSFTSSPTEQDTNTPAGAPE